MSKAPEPSILWWKMLLGTTLVVSLVGVAAILYSLWDLLAPASAAPTLKPPVEAPVQTAGVVPSHFQTQEAWKPSETSVQPTPTSSPAAPEDTEMVDLDAHRSELQAQQMAALKKAAETRSQDDVDNTPSREEVAEMEKQGVMVW